MAQTHKSLRLQIQRALNSCQSRARQRTLTVDNVIDAIRIVPAPIITVDAGAVPKSYRYPAYTTQVTVIRHARRYSVHAARVRARKCPYGHSITIRNYIP